MDQSSSRIPTVKMALQVLVGLSLCNVVWSANPAMAKQIMSDVSPALTAWLRYFSALVAYVAAATLLRIRKKAAGPVFMIPRTGKDLLLVSGIGVLTFCVSPLLQMTGLHDSSATDNALIVAMEPLITVAFAWLFLKERLTRTHLIAFTMALCGFALLSGVDAVIFAPAGSEGAHLSTLLGNLLILAALIGEACYSVLSLKLLKRFPADRIFGSALLFGVVILTVGTVLIDGPHAFEALYGLHWRSLLALLWLGPLGTALAYFYWMSVLGEASVASIALTLFIQPVLGAVWGVVFLKESLSPIQSIGAVAIVCALAVMTQKSRVAEQAPAPTLV